MIYLDSSALVKLVFDEAESDALREWLSNRTEITKVSSDLSTVELLRTCRRLDAGAIGDATLLLGGIDRLPLDHAILQSAAALAPAQLRSLDAIHLASALSVRDDLTALIVYDRRLGSAAADFGIDVVAPV